MLDMDMRKSTAKKSARAAHHLDVRVDAHAEGLEGRVQREEVLRAVLGFRLGLGGKRCSGLRARTSRLRLRRSGQWSGSVARVAGSVVRARVRLGCGAPVRQVRQQLLGVELGPSKGGRAQGVVHVAGGLAGRTDGRAAVEARRSSAARPSRCSGAAC